MLDIAQFFVGTALAQTAAAPVEPPGGSTSVIMNFLPLILIFGVFYVLLIRPQQKKLGEQQDMIKSLKRGDRVVTAGGIYGKVAKVEDDALTLEVAEGVQVKVVRSTIQSLAAKTEPVPAEVKKD